MVETLPYCARVPNKEKDLRCGLQIVLEIHGLSKNGFEGIATSILLLSPDI